MSVKRIILLKEHRPGSDVLIQPTSDYIKLTDGTLEQCYYRRFVCDDGFIRTPIDGAYDYIAKQGNGLRRIYFLGDATAENVFINDHRRFPALVEHRLLDKQNPYVSMNGGVSGATSLQLLTVINNKILNMADQEGIILFIVPSNDALVLVNEDGYWSKYPRTSPIRSTESNDAPIRRVRFDATQLCKLLMVLKSTLESTKLKLVLATFPFRDNDYECDAYLPIKFPSRAHWDSLRSRRREIVENTRRFAIENEVPLLDLYEEFACKTEYFYDDIHLNDRAQEPIADFICEQLLSKQLLGDWPAHIEPIIVNNASANTAIDLPSSPPPKTTIPILRSVRLKERSPGTDQYFVPTADYLLNTDGSCPGIPYRLRTDADGYITDGDTSADNGGQRIIFLGDSLVESIYIDENRRFVAATEKKLKSMGISCRCLNSGYSGSTTLHLANILINKIGIQPRTTIVFIVPYNDVLALQLNKTYWTFGDKRLTPILPWSNDEVRASRLNIESFSRVFKIIHRACCEFGLNLICATFPHRIVAELDNDEFLLKKYSNNPGLYSERLSNRRRVNNALRQECGFHNIQFLDLENKLQANPEYFYDEIHMNSNGSQFISELFAEFIANSRNH